MVSLVAQSTISTSCQSLVKPRESTSLWLSAGLTLPMLGSIHRELIRFPLSHYHAPQVMVNTISTLYQDLTDVVSTKPWTTNPIHLLIGVYQGDPLSVLVFNTVMNTLLDGNLGYSVSSSPCKTNLLQYANDTSIVADGPFSCRTLLSATETWLTWSGMNAPCPSAYP